MGAILKQPIHEFLQSLASKTPAPGGGATACLAGALACSQAQMVIEYSLNKKRLADHQALLTMARDRLHNARRIFLRLGDEDASAYRLLNELLRLDEADERRRRQLPAAAILCAEVPMSALATCADAARLLQQTPGKVNEHLVSDLRISAILLLAAAESCWQNVRVNLSHLSDEEAESRAAQSQALLENVRESLRPVASTP